MTVRSTPLDALGQSVAQLRATVEPLDDTMIARPAYPSEWTIAQVLSHLGSAAVIMGRRLQAALDGTSVPDEFAPAVWDEWNAKSPRDQVDGSLAADAAFLAALDAVTSEQRDAFSFSMGPINADFDVFVGLRLNEHALHTWDVAVALDPTATLRTENAALVVDSLQLIATYTAKPTPGDPVAVRVQTADPDRRFTIDLTADGANFTPGGDTAGAADLRLSAEAFIRLVYGRLDPGHTPPVTGDPALLDRLRATYPGP